ncbi:MAG: peroxide stress protein YaaA [Acidimicrobiia bacterium]|nr:peroxide stress protein YaaA [Acidimicrobiia bacterium]
MIILLSPAKTLDYESPLVTKKHTEPLFPDRVAELVDILAAKSPADLGSLMSISDSLSELNFERYQDWEPVFTPENARPAILAFKGDVYHGLNVDGFDARDLNYAQNHLRILSGLYGVLRPLDLMQPYRLEMGSKLKNPAGKDLYAYWGDPITERLNEDLETARPKALVNLASQEYFGAVNTDKLDARVITPVFKDFKNGQYKVISFFAKRARGVMASWLIRNRIDTLKGITEFDGDGYRYSPVDSTTDNPVFWRS